MKRLVLALLTSSCLIFGSEFSVDFVAEQYRIEGLQYQIKSIGLREEGKIIEAENSLKLSEDALKNSQKYKNIVKEYGILTNLMEYFQTKDK